MFRMFEARIGGKKLLRFATRFFHNLVIAPQIGDPQRRQAVLLRAEQIAWPAQLEIHLG